MAGLICHYKRNCCITMAGFLTNSYILNNSSSSSCYGRSKTGNQARSSRSTVSNAVEEMTVCTMSQLRGVPTSTMQWGRAASPTRYRSPQTLSQFQKNSFLTVAGLPRIIFTVSHALRMVLQTCGAGASSMAI